MSMRVHRAHSLRIAMALVTGFSVAAGQLADSAAGALQAPVPSSSLPLDAESQPESLRSVNYGRLAVMGGVTVGFFAGSYLYVKQYWWADQQTTFHFDQGPEQYAKNMDKVAHFFWGFFGADLAGMGFRWAGIGEDASYLYGALMNAAISLSIEMTDGFAPSHGFSVWDFTAGAVGGFYPLAQHHIRFLRPLNFKMSYWNHAPDYYDRQSQLNELNPARFFADNYGNQTYWATLNLREISPRSWKSSVPSWLALAVGARAGEVAPVIETDKQFTNVHVYVSVDIDIPQLLPEKGAFWSTLRTLFKYYHFPAPAIRVSPNVAVFGFYM